MSQAEKAPDNVGLTGFTVALSGFYNNDDFSDIRIRCEGHEFKTHRLLLASHSSVFKTLLGGEWKETCEGVIDIQESKLAVVDAMIFYMYNFHYDGGNHVDKRQSSLVFHAEVYSIADVYGMIYLKEHCKLMLKSALETGWNTDDFPALVQQVYTSTPAEDRGLRDILSSAAAHNSVELAALPYFKDELTKTPEFAADFAACLIDQRTTCKYSCKRCSPRYSRSSIQFPVSVPPGIRVVCVICGGEMCKS